jgi:hypothetical protein
VDRVRVIVPPLVTAYAIFIVMVVRAWREPTARAPRTATTRDVVWTTVGGYLVFLAIVAVFHVALGAVTDVLTRVIGRRFASSVCSPLMGFRHAKRSAVVATT